MNERTRRAAGPLAAAVVCAAVFGYLISVGSVQPPAYPLLRDAPDPALEGTIAFLRTEDGERCVYAVPAAGGRPKQLACSYRWPSLLGWTDAGDVVISSSDSGGTIAIDPVTAEMARSEPPPTPAPVPVLETSSTLYTGGPSGEPEVVEESKLGRPRVVFAAAEAPRDYDFVEARYSPDRRWIIVRDSDNRLLVAPRSGGRPRVVTNEAEEFSWYIPSRGGN